MVSWNRDKTCTNSSTTNRHGLCLHSILETWCVVAVMADWNLQSLSVMPNLHVPMSYRPQGVSYAATGDTVTLFLPQLDPADSSATILSGPSGSPQRNPPGVSHARDPCSVPAPIVTSPKQSNVPSNARPKRDTSMPSKYSDYVVYKNIDVAIDICAIQCYCMLL